MTGQIVQRHDPDRFLTALFAPADRRETLFTLYAFNHELARAREAAREPLVALMRLQWWREVVEGARRAHEVATPLRRALDEGRLGAADLLAMVDGREAEVEADGVTLEEWRAYVQATAGAVAVAAARALGADDEALATARSYGAAYGAAGILRHRAALAATGRTVLPPGRDPRPVLVEEGRRWLAEGDAAARGGGALPRRALSAVLVAALARRDLARVDDDSRPRGLADRLAVIAAYARGRA
jgi:15-cis-phytoene synthase